MGCSTGFINIIVFIFNFLCALVGAVLISIGTLFYLKVNRTEVITDMNYNVVPAVVIGLGVIVFTISFLGCCGVCQKSHCMLILYAVILLALFVAQLTIGIYGYIQVKDNENQELRIQFENKLNSAFLRYNSDPKVQEVFNWAQFEFKCCGVTGARDYFPGQPPSPSQKYPASCCDTDDANFVCSDPKLLHKNGCANSIYDLVVEAIKIVAYVAMGICAVEIVGALFALCLANSIRNNHRRRHHA